MTGMWGGVIEGRRRRVQKAREQDPKPEQDMAKYRSRQET
jgi:hypothetical protein